MNKTTSAAPSVTSLLQAAVAHHQGGRLSEAQALYDDLLKTDSEHFEALHFSGVIARQMGNPRQGIALIDKALAALHSRHIVPGTAHAGAYCNLAGCWLDCGDPAKAVELLRQALRLNGNYAIAHNNLGNALKAQGNYDEAIRSYADALRCSPHNPEAHHNLGLVLYLKDQHQSALQHFDLALEQRPDFAIALCSRAIAWLALGQPDRAILDCNRAITLMPTSAEAYFNRGIAHSRLQQFDQAADSYQLAIAQRTGFAKAWFHLGRARQQAGRTSEAVTAYQHARSCDFDRAQVDFALASLGAADIPKAAPNGYVRELFDQYADHFDAHLLGRLHYDVPRLIADCVGRHCTARLPDTLDLGCGTGLCAASLRPYTHSLTGVDLSQKMIDQAARSGLYNHLHCADLIEFLSTSTQRYDLVVAGDVFVYIGALDAVLKGVDAVLQPNGLFCFSVEHADESTGSLDYALSSSQRYVHGTSYLQRVIAQCQLELLAMEPHIGRTENHQNTRTLIVLTRKVTRSIPE